MITCAFPESADEVGRDPARLELLQLLDEHAGVDDAAGADHALLAPEDPRGHVPRLVGLAVDDDRVPGVRPAVVAADEIRVAGKQIDDLALALVAPLGADDDGRGHVARVCTDRRWPQRRSSRARACHHSEPGDAADADAVSAPAAGEPDVRLGAERPLDDRLSDRPRPGAFVAARFAGHGVGGRIRSEPDHLMGVRLLQSSFTRVPDPRIWRSGAGTRA